MNNAQIQALVAKLVSDLEAVVRVAAVRAVTEALGSAPATPAATPGPRTRPKPRKTARKGSRPAPAPVAAPKPAAKGKRARRSPADLDRDVGRIVAFVRANPGVRAEQARPVLGFTPLSWIPTIKRAVETKQLVATGNKAATSYSVPAAEAPARAVPPVKRAKKA